MFCRAKKILTPLLFLLALYPSRSYADNVIADRVVVAVNNIPYTQIQIERYINVKESLRDDGASSQVVSAENWALALDAFTKDMPIHQDASKSSGFRPTREAIQKLRLRSEKTQTEAPRFKEAFRRLGLSRSEIETEILKIATVENYKRGKSSLNLNGRESTSSWEAELTERTIVRYFDDAKTWKSINPKP